MSNELSPLIQLLKEWRTANELTQAEAVAVFRAEGLPVTLDTLQNWEIVRRGPRIYPVMANHIERELDDAFYDRNVNGDDSYLKELDKRYGAGFLDTDLFGENPEWDEGDAGWDTRGMALKIAKDLFKRGKGLEWNTRK